MEKTFRVGVTSDILDSRGEPAFGREPLKALDVPNVEWQWLPRGLREITAEHAAAFDALYVNSPRVPAAAVARSDLRLKLISRHGVGYDSVDVPAMTQAGVLVANTPNAVPRPVATIALTFILALAHRLMAKDRITRAGRWPERLDHMGTGLTGRTLGVIGAGRIGKELLRLAKVFDLKLLAADPYAETLELNYIGARHVSLAQVMSGSDFVVITCLLNEETRGLVGAPELALMKRSAFLVNVARGRWSTKARSTMRSPPGALRGRASTCSSTNRPPRTTRSYSWTTSSSARTRCAGPTSCSAISPVPRSRRCSRCTKASARLSW